MQVEYKSTKSETLYKVTGEKDRAFLKVTGQASTKAKVKKEVERIRIGGGSWWEVDALARQLAATY